MIAPATGIKKQFYDSFAQYLAENGYGVITYDNRGIGSSINGGNLNKGNASLISWGQLDMTAVLEELQINFPGSSYHLVGHSAGGQLVGLMDNASKLSSMLNIASSSGSLAYLEYPFKALAYFFLNIFIPFNTFLFGRANLQWVAMGEPLPKKVGLQWRKWCNKKGYAEADFGKEISIHQYDQLRLPSKWIYSADDAIANRRNVLDMIRIYSAMPHEITKLKPAELGFKEIGHMKFFKSTHKQLWHYATDWLEFHS